jgi:hypothetical protein
LRANHTIFTAPLAVDLTLQQRDEDAKAGYPGGTWLVHTGEMPEVDLGMEADGHGFEDSPDCERIAGGVNSKGAAAVAIGREANLLQWGFYGAPDRMTVPAKRAFLNAIVWMRQFQGQRPLVKKEGRGRSWHLQYIDLLEQYAKDEKTTDYLKKQFPAELVANGVDTAKLRKWYADNEEYFGRGKDRYNTAIDADLVKLKLSNRKPEFLDWLLAAFRKDANDATALALAQRYLGEHGADAATARAFVEQNREFLFFSDTAGYRWLVDENRQRAAANKR